MNWKHLFAALGLAFIAVILLIGLGLGVSYLVSAFPSVMFAVVIGLMFVLILVVLWLAFYESLRYWLSKK